MIKKIIKLSNDKKNIEKTKQNVNQIKKMLKGFPIIKEINNIKIKIEDNSEEYVYILLDILHDNMNGELKNRIEKMKKNSIFNKIINKNNIIEIQNQLLNYEKDIDKIYGYLEEFYKHKQIEITPLYPFLYDKNFNNDIYNKQEFNKYKESMIETLYNKGEFVKTKTQNIVSTYISPNTPYNGILLYHGVGTGKTCAAISISELFKDYVYENDKKINILTPSNTLTEQWKKEIFNYDKYEQEGLYTQCTGTDYTSILNNINLKNIKKESKINQINKIIKKYYNFYGYQKFSNDFNNNTSKLSINDKILYTQNNYSNSIIILDEIHYIRSINNKDKSIIPTLMFIARYSDNCKFILLSATPMYNTAEEIILLLNILLINDNREPINKKLYKNNKLDKKLLINYSRGYISYIRGENPNTFPIKLYPNDSEYISDIKGGIKFIKTNMKGSQLTKYNSVIKNNKIDNESQEEIEEEDILFDDKDNFSLKSKQCSNIVFPTKLIGNEGFDSCIVKRNEYYEFTEEGMKNEKPFLDKSNIGKYSCKYNKILTDLKKYKQSNGIIFIFSQFLKSGIIPLAIALELAGYNNVYEKDNLLGNKYGNEGNYILLTGSTDKKKLNELINICNDDDNNLRGEKVKIILGSGVIEEGLNFKRIREVHIIDSWFHFNKMDQVIGRAFRNKSHSLLVKHEQNVNIFLYVAYSKNDSKDEDIYKLAYKKDLEIQEVVYLLKTNSFDCNLTLEENIYNKPINEYGYEEIIDSQGNTINKDYIDENNSRECNYKDCDYSCSTKITENINDDTLSYFEKIEIKDIKKLIISIFKNNYILKYENIKEKLINNNKNIDTTLNMVYFNIALNELLESKKLFTNNDNIEGYIKYINDFYIFQSEIINNPYTPIEYNHLEEDDIISINNHILKTKEELYNNKNLENKLEDKPFDFNEFVSISSKYYKNYIDNSKYKNILNSYLINKKNTNRPKQQHLLILMYNFAYLDRLNDKYKLFLLKFFIKEYNDDNSIINEKNNYEKIFKNSLKYTEFNKESKKFILIVIYEFFKDNFILNEKELMFWVLENKKKKFYYYNKEIVDIIELEKIKLKKLDSKYIDYNKYKITIDNDLYCIFENNKFKIANRTEILDNIKKLNIRQIPKGVVCNNIKKIKDILIYLFDNYEEDKLQHQVMNKVNNDLNDRSACMELELLFRYYDYVNKIHINNTKNKWFYDSYETILSK